MSSLRRRAIVVHLARSTERSSTGGRVSARTTAAASVGVGEHPQPGERVADLGALEEGGVAGEAERHAALLERGGDQPALAPADAGDHADALGRHLAGGEQVLDLAGDRLRLRALVLAAPEPDRRPSARPAGSGRHGARVAA